MKFNTPILIILFNRPDLALKLLERLREIKPSKLYIAADGPREGREKDKGLCAETRDIVKRIDWDCEVKTLFRDTNVGCGIGVSSAITWLFENEEYGIILEDDCFPDLSFFSFCEELLIKYKDDVTVFQISGTNFQNGIMRGEGSYYFSHFSGIWGWATWRRAWATFTFDLSDVEEVFKSGKLNHVFQSKAEKLYWFSKLKKESLKLVYDAWSYQWLYNEWRNKGMGIAPNLNLISNIGFDNNSTHVFLKDSMRDTKVNGSMQFPLHHPSKKIDYDADRYLYENIYSQSIFRYYRLIKENGVFSSLKYIITKISKK